MKKNILCLLAFCLPAWAGSDLLIRFSSGVPTGFTERYGGTLALVSPQSGVYRWVSDSRVTPSALADDPDIWTVQRNKVIHLLSNPSLSRARRELQRMTNTSQWPDGPAYPDNPPIQNPEQVLSGIDPLLSQSWGLFQVGVAHAWQATFQGGGIIVAVTDTGVDYNHEDLIHTIWRNDAEIAGDGIDNDNNGYIDDIVGWDFSSNDHLPYDLSMSIGDVLFKGGNPGHGTHVAGVIAAQLKNSRGSAGVAPRAKIMALRFISENGKGDTAGAIGAIDYAVANGARIINASWGSEGEEEGDDLLRGAIARAEAKGVVFVAAAGNGRLNQQTMQPQGYNNDSDSKPMYPASYPHTNLVSVAAIDTLDTLASFSNYGKQTVDIGAPGVKILSTVPGNRYQDTLIDIGQVKITWDGTSMATPFVVGSLAAIWSSHASFSANQVISEVLSHAKNSAALAGKVATDGRLELNGL